MDSLRTTSSIMRLERLLTAKRIDIACIQETHNETTDTHVEGDYLIIFGGDETFKNQESEYDIDKKSGSGYCNKEKSYYPP